MQSDEQLVAEAIDAVLGAGLWALSPSGEIGDSEVYAVEIPISVVDRTEPEMTRIASKVSAFEKKMLLTEQRLRKVSTGFSTAGRSMTRNFTYPIIGGFALAGKAAIDFERDFAGVEKTVDASRKQLNSLRGDIRSFARETGHSTTEISAVAEAAGQLGVHVPQIMKFSKVMLEMGMATDLTSDMAAQSFARIANIMQEPQKNFERMASTVVDLGNKGAATEAEIVQMALNMAGAGRTIGMSTRDVLSFSEALASIGIGSEAGGSSFSRVMMEMAVAVDEQKGAVKDWAAVSGMSVADFTRSFEQGGTPALVAFIEGLARMRDEGGPVFQTLDKLSLGEVRVRRALLGAAGAGDMFSKSIETGNAAWMKNNALAIEANKRYRTQEWQLKKVWAELKDIFITLGQDLMPVIKDVAAQVSEWLKWFRELDPATRSLFIKGALSVAILGPVARLIGGITGGLANMVKFARILKMGGGFMGALTGVAPGITTGGIAGGGAAAGGAAAAGKGALAFGAGGTALGLSLPLGLIGAAIFDGFEERRRQSIKDELVKPGGASVDSKKGQTALESVGLGNEDLATYEKTIDDLRRLRKEQGGRLDIGQERDLNNALRARRDIYEDIAELRREETRNSIQPLQTQLGLLESVNGKLSEGKQERLNALIVQEDYAAATKLVKKAVEGATDAYVKSLGPLKKVQDGFQDWSDSAFAVGDGNERIVRQLRNMGSLGSESLLALVDSYGSVKDAVNQLADAQDALDWGWENAGGGGGNGGGKGKGGTGGKGKGTTARRPVPVPVGVGGAGNRSVTNNLGGIKIDLHAQNFDAANIDDLVEQFGDKLARKFEEIAENTP